MLAYWRRMSLLRFLIFVQFFNLIPILSILLQELLELSNLMIVNDLPIFYSRLIEQISFPRLLEEGLFGAHTRV